MKKQILGLVAASLLAFSVQAGDVPYSYIDVEYNSFDDADGFTLGGSFDFGDNVYGFGKFQSISADDVDTDSSTIQLGVGFSFEAGSNTDLIAEVSVVNADIDFTVGDVEDSGYALGAGVRSMVLDALELNFKAQYVDIFDESDTLYEAGGVYYFAGGFGLGASYESSGDDTDGFSLIARYTF